MNKKGFIHVLEALLVALVLIVTLPFLLFPVERETTWDVAQLTVIGEDVLSTMAGIEYGNDNESFAQDILEENLTTVDNQMRRILGTTSVGYGIRISGSIKNEVRIGCNCTRDQANILEQTLTPAFVNGRRIVFRIFPFDYERLRSLDFDVIFVNSSEELSRLNAFYNSSRDNKEVVLNHLRRGRGFVVFMDLSSGDLDQSFQGEVLGLAGGSGGGGNVNFANNNNVSRLNYKIGKYFYGVGADLNFTGTTQKNLTMRSLGHLVRKNVSTGTWSGIDIDLDRNGTYDAGELNFSEGRGFNLTLDGTAYNLTINRIDNATDFVHFNVVRDPGEYNFSDFVGGDPVAVAPHDGNANRIVTSVSGGRNALIVREFEGGRAAWMSSGTGDDVRGLLKSSVIWSAGEGWNILPRSISGRQIRVSSYVVQGEDFAEPYWLEMTLWFLFSG